MTFGPDHYVPVLKVKRGEKAALRSVSPVFCPRITPLLEIVERKEERASTVDAHLDTAFKGLAESVRPYSRCFIDAREIAGDGRSAAIKVFRRASAAGIVFTPVTGISRTVDVAAALSHQTNGIALRLTRAEFEQGELAAHLLRFVDQHGITAEEADLIVDLGAVDDLVKEGVEALTDAFVAVVPHLSRWRTFTISACAFPFSMANVERHSHNLVDRTDWTSWRDHLFARRTSLQRLPSFSDCAIQYPAGVEGFDPRVMQVSPTVRYTSGDSWLLIKGESTRVTPSTAQFPALATQLVYGHLWRYFGGRDHCNGCASIKAAADGAPRLGSLEAWRRLGTTHHITVATETLLSLPWI